MKKIYKMIIKIGKTTASKNAEWLCRTFAHQPKVPTKLLEEKAK